MTLHWLRKSSSRDLILVFNGFAMDHRPLAFLEPGASDVAVLSDFSDFGVPAGLASEARAYRSLRVVAWSLGVWIHAALRDSALAHRLAPGEDWPGLLAGVGSSVAVNGTLFPIDREFGIAPEIFEATLNGFGEAGRAAFFRNVCGSPETLSRFAAAAPERDLPGQVRELSVLREAILSNPFSREIAFGAASAGGSAGASYDRAWIGEKDRIIPARSQQRYWAGRTRAALVPAGHFPFFLWRSWEELFSGDLS